MTAYEYRVTALRRSRRHPNDRHDIGGAGTPFASDDSVWYSYEDENGARGALALVRSIASDAVLEGRDGVRIERREIGKWEVTT